MAQPLVQFVYAILHARYPVVVQPTSHIYFYLGQRCRQFLHPPPGRKFFEFGFHLLPRFRVDSYIDAASIFPQRESEIFELLRCEHADRSAFLLVDFQLQFPLQISCALVQYPLRGSPALCEQDDVVRIPYAGDSAFRVFLVKLVEIDVG